MGGHGGLNILPQKRWNVYNRDNRLKVSQDESKAREKEQAEQEAAALAESEFRHQRLLSRARQRSGEAGDVQAVESSQQEQIEAVAGALVAGSSSEGKLQHINFWREDELKLQAQHPEVEAAKRDETRKRGKQDFYTSDAKFDERFQFGYGVKGSQPWWVQRPSSNGPDPLLPSYQAASSGAALQGSQQHEVLTLSGNRGKANSMQGSVPAVAALEGFHSSEPAQNKVKKQERKRRRSSEDVSSEDEEVAAAKQFLLQALGNQAPAALLGGGDSPSGTSSSTSDSSTDTGSSSSSSTSCSAGEQRASRRRKRAGKDERQKKTGRSKDSSSSKRKRHRERRRDRVKEKQGKDSHKRRTKDSRRSSKRSRREDVCGPSDVIARLGASYKTVEELRAERVAREVAERTRASRVLVGASDAPKSDVPGQYNSAFGYAAVLKKTHR